jgi:hypothetical protein
VSSPLVAARYDGSVFDNSEFEAIARLTDVKEIANAVESLPVDSALDFLLEYRLRGFYTDISGAMSRGGRDCLTAAMGGAAKKGNAAGLAHSAELLACSSPAEAAALLQKIPTRAAAELLIAMHRRRGATAVLDSMTGNA